MKPSPRSSARRCAFHDSSVLVVASLHPPLPQAFTSSAALTETFLSVLCLLSSWIPSCPPSSRLPSSWTCAPSSQTFASSSQTSAPSSERNGYPGFEMPSACHPPSCLRPSSFPTSSGPSLENSPAQQRSRTRVSSSCEFTSLLWVPQQSKHQSRSICLLHPHRGRDLLESFYFTRAPQRINHGNHHQREHGRADHPTDHGRGDTLHHVCAGAGRPHDREQASDDRRDGHHHGPHPLRGAFHDRFIEVLARRHPVLAHASFEGLIEID